MKYKLFYILFLFLAYSIAQNANGSGLCGIVEDQNKQPVPFATVSIVDTDIYEICAFDGKFCFQDELVYPITLITQSMGFIPKTIVVNSKIEHISIKLEEDVEELNEIEVISSKDVNTKSKGYAAIGLDTKELQSQSIGLNNILNKISGVNVRESGGLGSRSDISLNGLGGRSIRFFIDGIPMEYYGSSYSINTIPVGLISRIEIFKGVVPIQLSNDALGGAVNLISHNTIKNQTNISYSIGSFNTHRVALFSNYRNKKNGLTLKFSSFYNTSDNDYEIWGDKIQITNPQTFVVERNQRAKRFHDAFASKSVNASIGLTNLKWINTLSVGAIISDMDKEIQHGSSMEVPYGEAIYTQKVISPYLNVDKSSFLIKDFRLKSFTSITDLTRKHIDTSRNIYNWRGEVEGKRTIGGEQFKSLNTLNQIVFVQRLYAGYKQFKFNYLHSRVRRQDSDPIVTQKTDGYWAPQYYNKNTLGVSYENKWFDDNLFLSLFSKYFNYNATLKVSDYLDGVPIYYSKTSTSSTPGYGASSSFSINNNILLTASIEHTSRLPEPEEVMGDGLFIMRSTELNPEKSWNYNSGINWIVTIKSSKINTSINGFYRDVESLIQLQQFDQSVFRYQNVNRAHVYGIDLTIDYNLKEQLKLGLNSSYIKSIDNSSVDVDGNINLNKGFDLPNIPSISSNGSISYTINGIFKKKSSLTAEWSTNYVSEFNHSTPLYGKHDLELVPDQFIHNSSITYTFPNKKTTLSINGNNLTNQQAFDNYALQKPGRAWYAKIVIRV
ncbi:MAG: TonB-dependent receptor [Flavobacteriales bacterium]|nr:TonB-dependent receptor [Flavobacteriales bacterium]